MHQALTRTEEKEGFHTGSVETTLKRVVRETIDYVLHRVEEAGFTASDAERRTFGIPLAKCGGCIAADSQLPASLADAMCVSSAPSRRAGSPAETARAAVYLTNAVADNVSSESGSGDELASCLNDRKRAFELGESESVEAIRVAHLRAVDFATGLGISLRDFTPPSRSRPTFENVQPTLRNGLAEALLQFFDQPPEA